jgi:hypothetical protein
MDNVFAIERYGVYCLSVEDKSDGAAISISKKDERT